MYLWRKRADSGWVRRRGEELLVRYGSAVAIIEEPDRATTLLEVSRPTRKEAADLQREFGGTIGKLPANWLQQFAEDSRAKPLRIGSRLIVARTAKVRSTKTILIPAEAAFGTGEHATTAMCLRMLERATRKLSDGWTMLDAGTGSGILAIAASRFGASRVLAIDNDPIECSTARRNARANGVRNIEFLTGDVLRQKLQGQFDIITANLFSEILIAALPIWSRNLAKDGRLILSGVLRSQERELTRSLHRNGFATDETRRRGKWIALLALRARKRS